MATPHTPANPPRCRRPDESPLEYRVAMGWDAPAPSGEAAKAADGERRHTRGPWAKGRAIGIGQVFNADGSMVCDVLTTLEDQNLIAAAPELLGLCIRFEAWLSETEAGQRVRGERTYDSKGLEDLRAVIAKATGSAS